MKIQIKILFVIGVIFFIGSNVWALRAVKFPYVTSSEYGRYYFKMLPKNKEIKQDTGICYRVTPTNEDIILWKTSGWYSHNVYLDNTGKYLVRTDNWGEGRSFTENDLAVAFYENGNLIKKYSIKELVKNTTPSQMGVFDPDWRVKEFFNYKTNQFTLKTIENIEYVFSIISGEIISKNKIKPNN